MASHCTFSADLQPAASVVEIKESSFPGILDDHHSLLRSSKRNRLVRIVISILNIGGPCQHVSIRINQVNIIIVRRAAHRICPKQIDAIQQTSAQDFIERAPAEIMKPSAASDAGRAAIHEVSLPRAG